MAEHGRLAQIARPLISPIEGQVPQRLQEPDERLGAKVVAFVEPAVAELGTDELEKACLNSGLARFKRPKEYVFVKSIPRSASGKLLRRKLRAGEFEKIENT